MNPFLHHVPGPQAKTDMALVRQACCALHELIQTIGNGPSRERSLALTALEEVAMWANKAAVKGDPQSVPE